MPDVVYTLRCRVCGCKFKQRVKDGGKPSAKCPNLACGEENPDRGYDPQGAPIKIGGSLTVKAVDETARIVMEDYKLGDLQDNLREGDIAAPKLTHHLQQQADAFFGVRKANDPRTGRPLISPNRMAAIQASALAGSYGPGVVKDAIDPVAILHQNRQVAQPNYIAGDGIGITGPKP
jgi:hypothetical protein